MDFLCEFLCLVHWTLTYYTFCRCIHLCARSNLFWRGPCFLDNTSHHPQSCKHSNCHLKGKSKKAMYLFLYQVNHLVCKNYRRCQHFTCFWRAKLVSQLLFLVNKCCAQGLCILRLYCDFIYWGDTPWTRDLKCREVEIGFCRKRQMQTGSSETLGGFIKDEYCSWVQYKSGPGGGPSM